MATTLSSTFKAGPNVAPYEYEIVEMSAELRTKQMELENLAQSFTRSAVQETAQTTVTQYNDMSDGIKSQSNQNITTTLTTAATQGATEAAAWKANSDINGLNKSLDNMSDFEEKLANNNPANVQGNVNGAANPPPAVLTAGEASYEIVNGKPSSRVFRNSIDSAEVGKIQASNNVAKAKQQVADMRESTRDQIKTRQDDVRTIRDRGATAVSASNSTAQAVFLNQQAELKSEEGQAAANAAIGKWLSDWGSSVVSAMQEGERNSTEMMTTAIQTAAQVTTTNESR